ncbi:MAG: site-specific integrase [Rhizobiaceae bacterium]|nr:site-specific integrase [Rhizobiaceae bacterium]
MSSHRQTSGRSPRTEISLHTRSGARKYVNAQERRRFLSVADLQDHKTRALCLMLTYTGCRLSEALQLTVEAIDAQSNIIAIRSLKKRRAGTIREVPVPDTLIEALLSSIGDDTDRSARVWEWERTWGWTQTKRVMAQAGIAGIHASPKGLRHGFGLHAVQRGIPLNLVQKWLGHADIATTAIYANAIGPEEYEIASRMWSAEATTPIRNAHINSKK